MVVVHNHSVNTAIVHMHFIVDFGTGQAKNGIDNVLVVFLHVAAVGIRNSGNVAFQDALNIVCIVGNQCLLQLFDFRCHHIEVPFGY